MIQSNNIIRPRLTDFHGIYLAQAQVDFAIPFLEEDIPLYIDPFLLWKSPSYQDKSLHAAILNSFNHLVPQKGLTPVFLWLNNAFRSLDQNELAISRYEGSIAVKVRLLNFL